LVVEDGNNVVYSTTPVQFNTGVNTITLSDGNTVLQVPPGATVTSPPIIVPVPSTVPDNAYVQFQADHVYFDEGQSDQVTLSGLTTRQPVSIITTSYSATVTSVSPAISNGNQPIVISGTATYKATNNPAPSQPLTLYVAANGFTFNYQVATDPNGNFSYTFTPPSGNVGGVYSTWADNPQVNDQTVQQTFTITQVSISPNIYNLTAPKNYPQTINFTATAGAGTTATNLHFEYDSADQPGGQFPGGLNVNVSQSVPSLTPSNSPTTIPVILTADNTVAGAGSIVLRLVSSETQASNAKPWQTVTINYSFADATPALQWSSYSSTAGVAPGGFTSTNLPLQNNGLATANNATLQLLNPDGTVAPSWVSLVNSSTTNGTSSLGSIAVGASVPVTVNFNPPSSQLQNDYTFIVRASAPNQPN
jgi:hypothetical protein